ncbi:hypothetical protein EDD16DRAFT_225406 [Pisolithus croceorrhizus]|nr:hypothetical protein EDD16DRAFT_225406 [Pisolithus croceorrhizus]
MDFINMPLPSVLVLYLILLVTSCFFIMQRRSSVKDLIWHGRLPLFGPMVISSVTGIVLDIFGSRCQGFPLLAVVISGAWECGVYCHLSTIESLKTSRLFTKKGATREAGYDRSSPRRHACRHNIPCHPTCPRMAQTLYYLPFYLHSFCCAVCRLLYSNSGARYASFCFLSDR